MSVDVVEIMREALAPVEGVVALTLGGSRARGAGGPDSDYDFGLYYEGEAPPDVARLGASLTPVVDDPPGCALTKIGEWGPWINGGGWLKVKGRKVDLLYRDLAQVRAVVADCRAGRVSIAYQPGHPHGFCSAILMGEAALGRVLSDRDGALAAIKRQAAPYPEALRQALIAKFHWEVAFAIENGALAVARGDAAHVAGCAYRALCCLAQVLFAVNRRYLINEKGALAEASRFETTIAGAERMIAAVWAAIGGGDLRQAIAHLHEIAQGLAAIVARST